MWGGRDNDWLASGAGADMLHGGWGDDTLKGDEGADTMSGGLGQDLFILIEPADAGDTVLDFTTSVDRIRISGEEFGISAEDTVAFRGFADANDAVTLDPTFIYDSVNARLYLDATGGAIADQVLLLSFDSGTAGAVADVVGNGSGVVSGLFCKP